MSNSQPHDESSADPSPSTGAQHHPPAAEAIAPEDEREVGVGPWPGGPDAWPVSEVYDPELLAHGDRRNVADHYRYWTMTAIIAELDTQRTGLHVAIENWGRDFNIGSVVRTANAFNVTAVHIIGRKRWNRRGAMVTDRYLHVFHHEDVTAFLTWAEAAALAVIGVDNVAGSVPLEHRAIPARAVMVFGEEGPGLSEQLQQACEQIVHITQYGSTRSINAGAAAGIAMWAWMLQHGPSQAPA